MKGKEIGSFINMVSKSKSYLPFLFAAGGLNKITAFNLVEEDHINKEHPVNFGENPKEFEKHIQEGFWQYSRELQGANPKEYNKLDSDYQPTEAEKELLHKDLKNFHEYDFSAVKVKTNELLEPTIKIQYWGRWNGAESSKYAKALISNSYPKAKFELMEDKEKTKNFIFTVNGKVVFDKVAEGKKNFKHDINDLICRVKSV